MLKKVLVAALVLLLTATPMVLAQDMSRQSTLQSQYVNQMQYTSPNLNDLAQLDGNGNLVINCGALLQRLTQLEQVSPDILANDPHLQLTMFQAEDLAQLCRDKGYTASSSGQTSGSNPSNIGS